MLKFTLLLLLPFSLAAQSAFDVIPLGIRGGLDESNLSAYLIAPAGSKKFICADAGTVRYGIDRAIALKSLKATESEVLKNYIRAYLVSHGHLDHLSGLIINSPDDTSKSIYAMPYVIDVLRNKYFSWESWANFADQGEKPALGKYHYQSLESGTQVAIANTDLKVSAFELAHSSPYKSTAFLLEHDDKYLLYLGDTGADRVEKSDKLAQLWQAVAALVKAKKLRAIFIEVSYANDQPETQLFGHLTPKLLQEELAALAASVGKPAMAGLKVVITHIKPASGIESRIKAELAKSNVFGVKFVFPEQGKRLSF
jgi:cAMP phosphodiesterase